MSMENRVLDITLLSGKDLNKVNLLSKMDVYAVVSITGGDRTAKKKIKTTPDQDGDCNPAWNFPMKFTVNEAELQMNRLKLDMKLVCQRTFGDREVGEVHVPMKELLNTKGNAEGKVFVSYQVRKPDGKPKGQISFSYKFYEKFIADAPPYASAVPAAAAPGKADNQPVMAYPVGPSSPYAPPSTYPPPDPYRQGGETGAYPAAPAYPPQPAGAYPPPPPAGYPQAGYGYAYPPQQPQPGYPYPPQAAYAPPPVVQPAPKRNKMGLGLGAGLLGGALGGLLLGDIVSDAGNFDCGGDFGF